MGRAENGALAKLSPLENIGLGVAAGTFRQRALNKLATSRPELFSETLAGTIEVSLLQPMLFCKNAVQQARPFTISPQVLYRGLLMSVTNMSVLTGAQVCAWSSSTALALALALVLIRCPSCSLSARRPSCCSHRRYKASKVSSS